MDIRQTLWLGYRTPSGRAQLELGTAGNKVLVVGARATDAARLLAYAAKESGRRPVVFDLDGALANSLSGHFTTFDYRSFLYDAFRLASSEAWHSQLAAAAYTLALDLTTEEEAIIDSAMQKVASDGALLSPVAVRDVMGQVEGFRGFYVDKLSGRVGSLRLFDATDDQTFDSLVQGDVIVDFQRAPYPLAAELSASLFIAKALAVSHSEGKDLPPLILTDAHRLFRSSPRANHRDRLLTALFDSPSSTAFSSAQESALSPRLREACQVRLSTAEAASARRGKDSVVTPPGAILLEDLRSGEISRFWPRRLLSKTGAYSPSKPSTYADPGVTRQVLEQVESFPLSTPESVLQFLSSDFLPSDVRSALSSLQARGALILEPKESGSGPRVFSLTLTEVGRRLLSELRR